MIRDRNIVLLAFGSPAESNAKVALDIVLESIHAEASALADMDTSSASPTSVRQLALSCRLEALKTFVSEFVTVQWAEGEIEAAK